MASDVDYPPFERAAEKVKTIGVGPVPQRIFDGMKQYEDARRGFSLLGFERAIANLDAGIFVAHRPPDAKVQQIFRISKDTDKSDLERITHFDIGTGRTISDLIPIAGEDWRGTWRAGGAIMVMDLDGREMNQLWRYWEDISETKFPSIQGELDNRPGKGRIERLTHDDFKYTSVTLSQSDRLIAFSSTKENGRDTLIYTAKLVDSQTGTTLQSTAKFEIQSTLVTPIPSLDGPTINWVPQSISSDDRHILITRSESSKYLPLFIIDLTISPPTAPKRIMLPGATEPDSETVYISPVFSRNPHTPGLFYVITSAYGDFSSIVSYDLESGALQHITTPDPGLQALRPIPWDVVVPLVTSEGVLFCTNEEGWSVLYAMPFRGPNNEKVVEVRVEGWEGGWMVVSRNGRNGKPWEVAAQLVSHRTKGSIVYLDLSPVVESSAQTDHEGNPFITVKAAPYKQAAAPTPAFRTVGPKLVRYKSFDGMDIPAMYYHPDDGKSVVPVVIYIHGGPEWQNKSQDRTPIHWYLFNEMKCAVIYPNVRGSTGYGKRYHTADDVYKREDSVKDIGALIDHIISNMKDELDASKIAVMGGSYGGYMVFTSLVHFSPQLTCGVANFGIAHWPTFLENTANHRRAHRRAEYGDESDPIVRRFLEEISPINHTDKITVPLSIAHGENDTRVTIHETLAMRDKILHQGGHVELIICEKEGHGFKQKPVIEYVNGAKIHFLERFLLNKD